MDLNSFLIILFYTAPVDKFYGSRINKIARIMITMAINTGMEKIISKAKSSLMIIYLVGFEFYNYKKTILSHVHLH